ncbi:MAG: glycosyltransferase [Spirochaetaceae bacterium]|jgi:glycosyltransferase involved in cell wall biosynthesis|nr:glycosyltransferase [Spirochaetaceae bacterium]
MGAEKPGLSVLMSVYYKETAAHLNECLQSLAAQTLPADEIVIVKDGGLTPELERCLAEWQPKLPLVIVGYEENKGLAYALNYGIQFCSRELTARMDSDDICLPDRFEKQLAYFAAHKDTVILGGNILEFYEDIQ